MINTAWAAQIFHGKWPREHQAGACGGQAASRNKNSAPDSVLATGPRGGGFKFASRSFARGFVCLTADDDANPASRSVAEQIPSAL